MVGTSCKIVTCWVPNHWREGERSSARVVCNLLLVVVFIGSYVTPGMFAVQFIRRECS